MKPNDAKARLFRKVALDRLSSPEQLDTMVNVVTLRSWVALVPFLVLLAMALAWSVFGTIPSKVVGRSILLQTEGLREVTTGSAGRITDMLVKVGDVVQVGQPVALLAQPDLDVQIRASTDRLAELERQEAEQKRQVDRAQALSGTLFKQQQAALNAQMAAALDRSRVVAERVKTQQALLDQGLITRQTLLNSQNELASVQQGVENVKSELQQIGLRSAEGDKRALQELTQTANQISETRRALEGLQSRLTQFSKVLSSYAGKVVEVKVGVGNLVMTGGALLTLEADDGSSNTLEAVIYIPAADGKRVERAMEAQIMPSTVRREEHGFMVGKVHSVSEYAATGESMFAVLQNRQLAQELSGSVSPIEVRATLVKGDTVSGYSWSSEAGPPFKVRSGTMGTAEIVVYRQAPITLVIPMLKKSLGLD
jgi:HlyD family secretion protein